MLYKDKLKQFDAVRDYVPHMTVGKASSMELLDKAYDKFKFARRKLYRFAIKV